MDEEARALAKVTLSVYLALEGTYHVVDISQAQAEALDIVAVAMRHAEELFEYLLEVFAAYADAVILYGHHELVTFVACRHADEEGAVG